MQEDLRARADARLEAALRERELADPREGYRARLRALRDTDAERFAQALRHYESAVLPGLAGEADPVDVWVEYGRFLAGMLAPGRTITVDRTGLATPYEPPLPAEAMILHLPDDRSASVTPLATPIQMSPPQRATYDLLVLGRESL
jgi:hypothetical protein